MIRTADAEIGELYINAVGSAYKVKRDGSLQLELLVSGQPAGEGVSAVWSIVNNPLGYKVSIDNNGVLTASGTVPFSNNYEITVQAAVTGHKQSNTTDTVTCKVTIDPVQITFDSQYAIVVSRDSDDMNHSTNPTRVRIEVKGVIMEKNSLRVQQNPFVRGLEQEVTASGENAVLSLNMTQ